MIPPLDAHRIRLPDGRWLGFSEYGSPDGLPMFLFHGTPGSRLIMQVTRESAARLGIRVISPDRPGYGLSDFQPRRTLLAWPEDVTRIADELGLDRFAVVGVSGGGPYAAACGFKIPNRVSVAGIISGVGPLNAKENAKTLDRVHRAVLGAVRGAPGIVHLCMAAMGFAMRRRPKRLLASYFGIAPAADKAILARPEIQAALVDDMAEAFRNGRRGATQEIVLLARPWGFNAAEIQAPVRLWHGEADRIVPVSLGRRMASAIPECKATFIPSAGHFWVFAHIEQILAELREAMTPTQAKR